MRFWFTDGQMYGRKKYLPFCILACFFPDVRTFGQTPHAKIMTIYSVGAWWVTMKLLKPCCSSMDKSEIWIWISNEVYAIFHTWLVFPFEKSIDSFGQRDWCSLENRNDVFLQLAILDKIWPQNRTISFLFHWPHLGLNCHNWVHILCFFVTFLLLATNTAL